MPFELKELPLFISALKESKISLLQKTDDLEKVIKDLKKKLESLNVGVACSILLYELGGKHE